MKRLSLGLLLSCAAHAAVVAGVVAVLDYTVPQVLFVDLVHGLGLAVSGNGAGGGGSSGEPGAGDKAELRAAATRRRAPAAPRRPVTPTAEAPQPPASAPVSPTIVTPVPEPERTRPTIAAVEPTAPDVRAVPETRAVPSAPADAASPSAAAGIGSATSGAARGGEAGLGAGDSEPRAGQGGSGSGGGLGAGRGANQGSAVALAVPGDGAGVPPEYERYYTLLRGRLHDALRYPAVARRRSIMGRVVIAVRVTTAGVIDRAHVVTSSTHSALDEAALDAAHRLRVPFPPGLRPRVLELHIPVDFVLQ